MTILAEIHVTPTARAYAEGWQSWSPTTWYSHGESGHRPSEGWQHIMRFRPGTGVVDSGLQGEGLLVVEPGDGAPARVFAARDARSTVPTIRASWQDDRLIVESDAPHSDIETWTSAGEGADALAEFGTRFGKTADARVSAEAPRVWCTWYQYFEQVTATDVLSNLRMMDELKLDIDVVQIDDGWSRNTGEWLDPRSEFGQVRDTVAAIRDTGRRAGIWVAPFSVGSRSSVAREHPDWLVGPAGYNWGDDLVGLDLTHPDVRDFLSTKFAEIRDRGVDYVKLDFLYSGAVPGVRYDADATGVSAYRSGMSMLREILGSDTYIVGCGAPILPSVGIVDAMRVASDTFHEGGEDGSQGLRGKMSLQARAWQDGLLWTTDPDCLVARPEFVLRDEWAEVVLNAPGIRGFSDKIAGLDDHGHKLVRRLLNGAAA